MLLRRLDLDLLWHPVQRPMRFRQWQEDPSVVHVGCRFFEAIRTGANDAAENDSIKQIAPLAQHRRITDLTLLELGQHDHILSPQGFFHSVRKADSVRMVEIVG